MKTQYRIIRKNSRFGWTYAIQRKFWFMWFDTVRQPFNKFDKTRTIEVLEEIIQDKKDFAERKKNRKLCYN